MRSVNSGNAPPTEVVSASSLDAVWATLDPRLFTRKQSYEIINPVFFSMLCLLVLVLSLLACPSHSVLSHRMFFLNPNYCIPEKLNKKMAVYRKSVGYCYDKGHLTALLSLAGEER